MESDGDEPGVSVDDVDLRAEDDAQIAAELEAEAARRAEEEARAAEEAARKAAEAEAQAEVQAEPAEDEDEDEPKPKRPRRRGRSRRRAAGPATLEGTFDHGEEGYGLWLDPAVQDDPIYAEHWAGHRPIEVTIEEDQIVIRRAGDQDEDSDD